MEISEKEFLAPGHRGCAGCGATVGVRLALKALGKNTVAVPPRAVWRLSPPPTQKLHGKSPGYTWPLKTQPQWHLEWKEP